MLMADSEEIWNNWKGPMRFLNDVWDEEGFGAEGERWEWCHGVEEKIPWRARDCGADGGFLIPNQHRLKIWVLGSLRFGMGMVRMSKRSGGEVDGWKGRVAEWPERQGFDFDVSEAPLCFLGNGKRTTIFRTSKRGVRSNFMR